MTIPLRYATAGQEIPLGYFLDSTDGDTEETGLTIANTDIKLWKHGHTTLTDKNSGGATHISNGVYYCVLDATDSNTKGGLVVFVHKAGALSVKVNCFVYSENIYDTMCSTDVLKCDLWQIGGVAQSATDLKDFADAGYDPATNKVQGVVLTDTTTTNTDMRGTDGANTTVPDAAGVAPTAAEIKTAIEAAGSHLALILEDTAELQGNQGAWITATGFSTHSAANVWAVGTRALTDKAGFALSTSGIAAIWDDLIAGMVEVGSIGKLIADNLNATITSRAPSGEYNTQMGYIPSNLGDVPTATELNSAHGAGSWEGGGAAPTVGEIRTEMEGAGTKLTLTLGDTDELQGNQAAWATAVGFSTHSAADVKTAMEAAGSKLTLTLADTDELQGNQGAWATATGFSTHNAAAIWSVAARILTANTNFNDLDAAAIKAEVAAALQDIKLDHLLNIAVDTDWATTVHLDSVIGHMADVGTSATFNRTTDALEAIRNRGDSAWVTATGFNTTTPPTVIQIRQEMDSNSTKMAPSQILNDYKATGFSTHNAAAIWSVAARILTANTNFNDLDAAAIKAEVAAALQDIKLDHLINIAVDTDWATTVHLDSVIGHMADVGTAATFDRATDALEALRSRGDAEWITATGFNTTTPPTVIQIRQEMDSNSTKMAPSQVLAEYKATGFSTHSATNVWSVGTRALTDKSGFALSTAGIKAIWDQLTAALTTVGSIGKLLVDNINATISSRNSITPPTVGAIRTEMEGAGTKLTEILEDTGTTLDEMIERILGLEQENFFIDNTTYTGVHLTSARIRIYSVAGSVGTASDVIATYTMTASYTGDEMDDYKVVKV